MTIHTHLPCIIPLEKHDVLQGSILGPLLCLFYIHYITEIRDTENNNNKSKLVSFLDDTSLIITRPNPINFMKYINRTFTNITNNWFNPLPVNVENMVSS
jgi:hypothetical protein